MDTSFLFHCGSFEGRPIYVVHCVFNRELFQTQHFTVYALHNML